MSVNAAAYIRKSTSGKDEDGCERQEGSFERQKASIEDYARTKNIKIIRWYEEPVTGKAIRKREEFLRMVKDAKSPSRQFQVMIFGEYDRFMRHVKEAMRFEVELDDVGMELHFTNLRNDGSPADEIYKSLARQMAADYSRELARKVIQGMIRKANLGCWLGGVPPFGYRTYKDADKKYTWLVIYDPEAKTVRIIFDLSYKGWGHRKIARWLNEQGIRASEAAQKRNSTMNRNPDGRWSGESVRQILRNPVYKGVSRWNKRARVDCFDWALEGKGTVDIKKLRTESQQFQKGGSLFGHHADREFYIDRTKPEKEWIAIEGKAPEIIKPEIFDAIQARFKKYSSDKWRRANTAKALMTGAMVCMVCGGNRYQANSTNKIIKSTGERAYYGFYRCSGDVRKGSHASLPNNLILKQAAVDKVVEEGLCARIQHFSRPGQVTALFEDKVRAFLDSHPNRLAEVERELKTAYAERDRMIDGYRKFEMPIPENKVKELKDRLRLLEEQKDSLIAAGHDKSCEDGKHTARRFFDRIMDAQKGMKIGDLQEKIHIRQAFLPKAEVSWYNEKPKVRMLWRRVPEFAGCQVPSTSTL